MVSNKTIYIIISAYAQLEPTLFSAKLLFRRCIIFLRATASFPCIDEYHLARMYVYLSIDAYDNMFYVVGS